MLKGHHAQPARKPYMEINKRFEQRLSVNSSVGPGWQKRQTLPGGDVSLHYCASTGCQVTNAKPRVQRMILRQKLPANYQRGNMLPFKTQPRVSAELICLITSL